MKNSQKGFVAPLIIGIVVLLVIGSGVYIYESNNIQAPTDVSQMSPTPSLVSTSNVSAEIKVDNKKSIESPKTSTTPIKSTVKVISPNGGETFVIGKNYTVRWWDDSDAGNKIIFAINSISEKTLIPISGSNFMRSSGIDGTYAYAWKVGTNLTVGSYKLMICKANTNECDESDNYFKIVADSGDSPVTIDIDPTTDIVSFGSNYFLIKSTYGKKIENQLKIIYDDGAYLILRLGNNNGSNDKAGDFNGWIKELISCYGNNWQCLGPLGFKVSGHYVDGFTIKVDKIIKIIQ